jgi:hypothetical protein
MLEASPEAGVSSNEVMVLMTANSVRTSLAIVAAQRFGHAGRRDFA